MLNNYFTNRREIQQLYTMSDRELLDIGISRGDIHLMDHENGFFYRLKQKLTGRKESSI
jgi:hypothetical protein